MKECWEQPVGEGSTLSRGQGTMCVDPCNPLLAVWPELGRLRMLSST